MSVNNSTTRPSRSLTNFTTLMHDVPVWTRRGKAVNDQPRKKEAHTHTHLDIGARSPRPVTRQHHGTTRALAADGQCL